MFVGAALGFLLFVSIAPVPACDPVDVVADFGPAFVRANLNTADLDAFRENRQLPDRFDEKQQMTCVAFDHWCLEACSGPWGACQGGCTATYPPGPARNACVAACDQTYYECYYPECCID
jgi:hypothetical protein